jgi:hypothetical protein
LRGGDLEQIERAGVFARYVVAGQADSHELAVPAFTDAVAAPIARGGSANRLSAPGDAEFGALDSIAIAIPDDVFAEAAQVILEIDWVGDALRVYAGEELVADQFWSGRRFELDLVPIRERIRDGVLHLKAFAWSPGSAVYVDPRVRPEGDEVRLEISRAALRQVRIRSLR